MAFQDDLRAFLERVATSANDAPRSWFNPDVRVHRQHLLRELQRLEAKGRQEQFLERTHAYWSEIVDEFAHRLGTELVNGLCYRQSPDVVTHYINIAISRKLDVGTTGSFVTDAELDRLVEAINVDDADTQRIVEQYALETRALRRSGERRVVTPLGRVALELPDRDLVRWLLTAEAVQSRGVEDEWRLSRKFAAQLHAHPSDYQVWDVLDSGHRNSLFGNWQTLKRLAAMGLGTIGAIEDEQTTEIIGQKYDFSAAFLPLLAEIAFRPDTPFAVLVEALLSDEAEATVASIRPTAAPFALENAAMATTRHARMVTHEIRNALVPVQGSLERLYRDAEKHGFEEVVSIHREAIDGGIDRIFRFVKDMMEVAERGIEPPESFEVGAVIQEAIEAVVQEFGQRPTYTSTSAIPLVKGNRHRFMLAMVNLLRNAAQARSQGMIAMEASWSSSTGEIIVAVDDDGPGVPSQYRADIFKQGFFLRAGGTGQGLALVREVIESEMSGQATCEDSSLGGARFVVRVPVTERQSS